nr:hypothetical protein [Nitrospinaceae bacterium]NIR54672.1 hypothetical protein [Nitrospinaceae bacterium]NIS85089.1 hypothetical protein [Nitrospinaceae bacterium]NIT81906.1 hypothetical protein [Nitrospinaceae bacterium]NIU44170.1 hypothetical protein [Nitrospinaceae bacterium]
MTLLKQIFGPELAEYNEWQLRWAVDHLTGVLAVMGILIPIALWFFWSSLSRIRHRAKKFSMFGLRVLAFGFLLFLMLQPELEFQKSRTLQNSIAVLLDDSKSLAIKTFPEEVRRIDLVRKTLDVNRDFFKKLSEDFNLEYFLVSDRIEPLDPAESDTRYQPRGLNTDFTRVFSDLQKQFEGKSLQGVLLFSDGADLTQERDDLSRDLLDRLTRFQGPLHTFQAGTNESFRDLAIETLEVADFGFVHQPLRLRVKVRASAIGNKNVPLVLKEGERVLVSRILELREDRPTYEVDLQFTPNFLGKQIYTISLPVFAGESITSNNRKDFQVKIIRDRIRVLHLNGRPSWDSRFLREVLVKNPKVDLLSFFILRTLGDDVAASTSQLSLIPFPSNLLFSDYLNSFDLVIFQNFQYAPFIEAKYLGNIRTFVQRGGAFAMVGGELSFQGGGYDRTAIEEILPVRLARQRPLYLKDEYRPTLSRKLVHHPMLRLEKESGANRKAWNSLPPLNGLNVGLNPKSESQVLATYEKKGPSTSYPVLVAGEYGEGRALVFATDSSWNWNFRRIGAGGSGRYYQRFWNNAIAWLTKDPETRPLQLETDKERYDQGDEVLIKFKVLDENYNPSIGRKVRLTLQAPSGERRTVTMESEADGNGSYQFVPEQEGFYRIRAQVEGPRKPMVEETSFGVLSETAEFRKPRVNEFLLQKFAEVTGGTYTVLEETTDLSGHEFENPEVFLQAKSKTIPLWNNWW